MILMKLNPVMGLLRGLHLSQKNISLIPQRLLTSKDKLFDDSNEQTKAIRKEITDFEDKKIYSEYKQEKYGIVYDKKPFKYHCIEGKAYFWCSCGHSHKQPFCDGTHKNSHLQITLKPLRWDCKETKEYWFCNCKQTKHPPFCDGTHQQKHIQEGPSTIRDHYSPPVVIQKIKK